ncbi:extracellular solute-binding protein [Pusillimonas noertemannii]|uniref:sn-glycerol-3-phosphate-binding periplasmic protein UgpB n=1 Tax=Pusillimonas noertemannii TaxID=305977 RepID=A0A2U1CIU6_9BURK|nr:extracellular solute-binding protein [Pusillimonas noertemannii]NYT69970.1 extracellular solute-binding protein [Pusillimonas noertemannii]PVY60921.1 carbohydrate ABC transporter substrate-binding protein (CUT1 family) [Pusillimonas noertemannii]TFL08419.1 extracellular solute-binding protein [Pusillimonas noertemannii]
MKIHRLFGTRLHNMPKAVGLAAVAAALAALSPAASATDITVWHALNPHNSAVFEKLVKQFNRDSGDVTVRLESFGSPEALESKFVGSAKGAGPSLVQLNARRSPDPNDGHNNVKPLYSVLAKHPIKDAKWFIHPESGIARDDKGRLLAFPYMAEVPVMFYNVGAFKKAGLKPEVPNRAWDQLQGQVVDLANRATRNCPITSDQPVSINLENLAAVNNQFFTSNQSGKAKGAPSFSFDNVFVRHLSLMISWVRNELMVKPEFNSVATQRFANNECAVLLSDSSNLGTFREARSLDFGVSGLPYYPQVTPKPGNPFVSGSALWVTAGQNTEHEKAVAEFLAWLAQPKNASAWFQDTGFLPLTEQAFAATSSSYFNNLGDWHNLVAVYNKKPAVTASSFKIKNYPRIRAMFHEKLHRALDGKDTAPTALKSASAEAGKLMSGK